MEPVTFVTEPLLHPDFVQFQVVAPLLGRLRGHWAPTLAAPILSRSVVNALEERGIQALSGDALFPPWLRNSRDEIPSYVWSWARDSVFGWNRRVLERVLKDHASIRVNFSMTSAFTSDCWFVQSRPLGPGLDAMRPNVDVPFRIALGAVGPFVDRMDWRHVVKMAGLADRVYASTQHVASWLDDRGVVIEGVFPLYYSPDFRPSTATPSRDYVLGYLGKETDVTAMEMLLDTGLPIRLFGAKSAGWVGSLFRGREYPNARVLGRVSQETLRKLYTNALVTVFPFTEEPFGLVPVESMACGTPVITYDTQGPGETVVDGKTGWTVTTADELVTTTQQVFRDGYPKEVARACLDRARDFSLDTVASNWQRVLTSISAGNGNRLTRSGSYRPARRRTRGPSR